jgi:molybdenum cofactor cytidylyltransferase
MMIDAIVLAAGRSRRMGSQKLLLPFAGQTVIGHVVDQVLAGNVRNALVVVGHENDAVAGALANKTVTVVVNRGATAEMLGSVRAGLCALPKGATAAVIVLGDQPSIRAGTINQLIDAFQAADKGIVVPAHGGKRGHPLLVAARHFHEIQTRYDGAGVRGLLAAHADDVAEIELADSGVLADMDRPEDYEREVARHRSGEHPHR